MLIDVKPDWAKLEALYAPMSDEDFYSHSVLERREILRDNFHEYAPRNLKIRDKEGNLVPFKMNRSQLFLHHVLEQQKSRCASDLA